MSRFRSGKKMIRREHAAGWLSIDVSFGIDEKTNLLGKEMLELYVSIDARLINASGKWFGKVLVLKEARPYARINSILHMTR